MWVCCARCLRAILTWLAFCQGLSDCCVSATGHLSACVNCASLALMDAGIPLRGFVTSCSAAMVDEEAIVGTMLCFSMVVPHCSLTVI